MKRQRGLLILLKENKMRLHPELLVQKKSRKGKRLFVYMAVNPEQREIIEMAAGKLNISLSRFCRGACFQLAEQVLKPDFKADN